MTDGSDTLPTQEGYDRWAAVYDTDGNPLVALEEPRMDALLGEVRGLSILDLGCGTGRHSIRLARAGAQVDAIDFSAEMLNRAREKAHGLPVRFHVHDLTTRLPFESGRFDRVVCGLVLDHIHELNGFFAEVKRLCNPAGFAAISIMHPAMMLLGVQARFTDPHTGQKVYPKSAPNQVSDYINSALAAGLRIERFTEHLADEQLVRTHPRADKYLGWPMLMMLKLVPDR